MITLPDASFASLRGIDWSDTASILTGCAPVYEAVRADKTILGRLLDELPGDLHLTEMCERYDFLDKLVIFDDPAEQVRLRVHLYRDGYFDRPHHHRWSFFSGIYRGAYLHRIYGRDTDFGEGTDPRTLRPIVERFERAGSTYALDHTAVHTVQAEADTISILVRGPATRDRFLILDIDAGRSFWVYGAAQETPHQREAKRMTPDQLADTIARVQRLTGLVESSAS